jgi:hypothetical protein
MTLRKLDPPPSPGEEGKHTPSLVSFSGAQLSRSPPIRGRKQIQLPKRRAFPPPEYRTMEKVQKPSNSMCYTESSEPFRIYFNLLLPFQSNYICQILRHVLASFVLRFGDETKYYPR